MEVTLIQVLEAREQRVLRQKALLQQFHRPLVCFTMNIPGPVKKDRQIEQGFALGLSRLEAQLKGSGLPVLHRERICADTGCEGYLVVDADSRVIKNLCMEIEQADPLGRLFDMDVLDAAGEKLGRLTRRQCLICGQSAQVCGRSRAHTVQQLQDKVHEILSDALGREDRQHIAQAAVKSLLFEVAAAPKPGLVDRLDRGSHRDMDIFTFLGSASVLYPYFETCAAIGQEGGAPQEVFSRLRYPGKLAEAAMYRETEGVNTHKGAIFSLGILCAAAGLLGADDRTAEKLLSLCAQMTGGLVAAELGKDCDTAGQKLYRQHGVTGVRGQAEAGFPAVRDIGLPVLREGLARGLSMNDAAIAALLHMLPESGDTNLLARGGPETRRQALDQVKRLLEETPYPTGESLSRLNAAFVEKNLSPGGTADLLSLTLFLHFLDTVQLCKI